MDTHIDTIRHGKDRGQDVQMIQILVRVSVFTRQTRAEEEDERYCGHRRRQKEDDDGHLNYLRRMRLSAAQMG